ncbi:MAG: transglutaminase domain-containing protein [Eubacterium sp.]
MKKIFKILYFIILAVVLVFVYNYFSGYSLFSLEDINAPVYQEEIEEVSDGTGFKKLYYSQLDKDKRKIYDKIYFAIKDYKETVRIYQKIDSQELFNIVGFVIAENPELFWSNGGCSVDSTGKLTFDYIYTPEEIEVCKAQIESNTKDIIAQANTISDEYERALLLFDFISENVTYDDNAAENLADNPKASTMAGALVDGKAVCGGYSRAYQYLLSECSLNAETVHGIANTPDGNQNHAWTLQYLDGNYYYTDATWGDSYEGDTTDDYTSHIYFCMTEKDMSKTHTLDSDISYPSCTAKADNYFVKEGLYFADFSKASLKKAIRTQIENGNNFIELKFENKSDYDNAVNDLITNKNICYLLFEIDPFQRKVKSDTLSYSTDDTQKVLTLILTGP